MACYAVFVREEMHDADEFAVYSKKAAAARGEHKMTPHVFYGAVDVLEGPPVDGVVIVEFPDKESALHWYNSAAYQDAKKHRQRAADYRVFIVEGLSR